MVDERRKNRPLRHSKGVLLIRDEDYERLQRGVNAGYKLYAALKRHHNNDLFELQFAESVERVLCAYEQRTGRAVTDEH